MKICVENCVHHSLSFFFSRASPRALGPRELSPVLEGPCCAVRSVTSRIVLGKFQYVLQPGRQGNKYGCVISYAQDDNSFGVEVEESGCS